MKAYINNLILTVMAMCALCGALLIVISNLYRQYLAERVDYPLTAEQSLYVTDTMKRLCDIDSDFCVSKDRVQVRAVKDFFLSSLPVIGELFLTGEAVYSSPTDLILLPDGLFDKNSLFTVTVSHEILHLTNSDRALIPGTSRFCEDHNRIKQRSVDKLVSLKHQGFTYLQDKHIYSSGNQVQQCQSV